MIMKKILILLGIVLMMTACTGSLPGRFTRLADKVEAKGKEMSPDQWDKCNQQFEALIQEYSDKYDSFDSAQKKEINKAIARYSKAAVLSGISGAADAVSRVLEEIPGVLDGLLEGVGGFLEGLGSSPEE